MAFLLILQMAVLLYYGGRKAGFHEDELYTYYSSNKTAGLFVNDRQWTSQEDIRNDFVVLEGERFRYNVVRQMQSWDVHPPFYYFCFHTICSLFPDLFSKWLGITVNLIAYAGSYILLAYIVYLAVRCGGSREEAGGEENRRKAEKLSFLVCLFWGFSGASDFRSYVYPNVSAFNLVYPFVPGTPFESGLQAGFSDSKLFSSVGIYCFFWIFNAVLLHYFSFLFGSGILLLSASEQED